MITNLTEHAPECASLGKTYKTKTTKAKDNDLKVK